MTRRAAGKDEATIGVGLQMSLLKLPHLMEQILPFAVLFGAMLAFWRLARVNEVVVARAAGVSVWQFLLPAIGIALTLGVIHITIFNPVASVLLLKFEQLESRYLEIGRAHV